MKYLKRLWIQYWCKHEANYRTQHMTGIKNFPMVVCTEFCPKCGKVLCVTRAFDWGYDVKVEND